MDDQLLRSTRETLRTSRTSTHSTTEKSVRYGDRRKGAPSAVDGFRGILLAPRTTLATLMCESVRTTKEWGGIIYNSSQVRSVAAPSGETAKGSANEPPPDKYLKSCIDKEELFDELTDEDRKNIKLSDSNAASKAAALKLLENVRELPFVPTDHAGAKWNSTEPLKINKIYNMQKFILNLVITVPAVHNVYSRIISSSVVTTAPLESAFSIAMMPAW